MNNIVVAFISALLCITTSQGQSVQDSRRITGKWNFTIAERPSKSGVCHIQIDRDSLVLYAEDEDGNYDTARALHFNSVPKRSGPKGLYYETVVSSIDADGDTVVVSRWVEFTNLHRKKVNISVGALQEHRYKKDEGYMNRFNTKSRMDALSSMSAAVIGTRLK